MADERKIQLLDRVLTQIAVAADDAQLAKVCENVLAAVLNTLDEAGKSPKLKAKAIQVISQINGRVKPSKAKMPLQDLVEVWKSCSHVTRNFVAIFLFSCGFPRATKEEQVQTVSQLLNGVSKCMVAHRKSVLVAASSLYAELSDVLPSLPAEDIAIVSRHLLDVVVLVPGPAADVPAGTTPQRAKTVATFHTHEAHIEAKLGALQAASKLPMDIVFDVLVAGSCDGNHRVQGAASTFLKKCDVDRESNSVVNAMFNLYLENSPSIPLKIVALKELGKSHLAVNSFPRTAKVMFDSLFGEVSSNSRIHEGAVIFMQFVFRSASDFQLMSAGPSMVAAIITMLRSFRKAGSNDRQRVMLVALEAIGLLGERIPAVIAKDITIASDLVQWIISGPVQTKETAVDALKRIAAAYCDVETGHELLWQLVNAKDVNTRVAAVMWAARAYPFDNVDARCAALVLSADARLEVTQEAYRALNPPNKSAVYPAFTAMADRVSQLLSEGNDLLHEATLNFLKRCKGYGAGGGGQKYLSLLITSLSDKKSSAGLRSLASVHLAEWVALDPARSGNQVDLELVETNLYAPATRSDARRSLAVTLGLLVHMRSPEVATGITTRAQNKLVDSSVGAEDKRSAALALAWAITVPGCEGPNVEKQLLDLLNCSDHPSAKVGAAQALTVFGRYNKVSDSVITSLKSLISDKKTARTLKEECVSALGSICLGSRDQQLLESVWKALLEDTVYTNIEVMFRAGQALSICAGGWSSTASVDETIATVDAAAVPFSQKKADVGQEPLQSILNHLFQGRMAAGSLAPRCATSVFLLALLQHLPSHPNLNGDSVELAHVQTALVLLVRDPHSFTPEVACRALSLCFERGDGKAREELLNRLSASLGGKIKADTSVFPKAALEKVKAPHTTKKKKTTEESDDRAAVKEPTSSKGGSVYVELLKLSRELGRTSLVYHLMALSVQHSFWSTAEATDYQASGLISLARTELGPFFPKLLPRLFLACYDPRGQIASTAKAILKSLDNIVLAEIIKTYWEPCMDLICKSLMEPVWEVREAAVSAIPDCLNGRDQTEAAAYLPRLWKTCFLALDDLKGSVREAALPACRSLSDLSLKTISEEALEVVLPTLLREGLQSKSKEVQGYSLDVLGKHCKKAGCLLTPHVVVIVEAAIEAVSGLEPEMIRYMASHASTVGLSADQIQGARVQLASMSPLPLIIEDCLRWVDSTNIDDIVGILKALIKRATGLGSRKQSADTARKLAKMHPTLVKGKHANSLSLALLASLELDSNGAKQLTAEQAGALGVCAALGSNKLWNLRIVPAMRAMCIGNTSSSSAKRMASAILGLSLAKCDSRARSNGLLVAIIWCGRHDADEKIREAMDEAWSELGAVSGAITHASLVIEIALELLAGRDVDRKRDGSVALGAICKSMGSKLDEDARLPIQEALLKEIEGRLWKGKSALFKAVAAAALNCSLGTTSKVALRIAQQSARGSKSYRKKALSALDGLLDQVSLEALPEAKQALSEILNNQIKEGSKEVAALAKKCLEKVEK